MTDKPDRVVVIGAGPVGLCLALALAQAGIPVCLIEALGDDNFLEQVPRASCSTASASTTSSSRAASWRRCSTTGIATRTG
jgi:2-polyprenyl-6-methoxyphenol hydroxylase-like FAD-dependent oxidoreductase